MLRVFCITLVVAKRIRLLVSVMNNFVVVVMFVVDVFIVVVVIVLFLYYHFFRFVGLFLLCCCFFLLHTNETLGFLCYESILDPFSYSSVNHLFFYPFSLILVQIQFFCNGISAAIDIIFIC